MKVLVAGATSVPGVPVIRELRAQGHEVVGLTRSLRKAQSIASAGADPVIGDVFDRPQITGILTKVAPEVVISLLTTLPRYAPTHFRSFRNAIPLWSEGVPNLVAAAQQARVSRVVAESVIFAMAMAGSGQA